MKYETRKKSIIICNIYHNLHTVEGGQYFGRSNNYVANNKSDFINSKTHEKSINVHQLFRRNKLTVIVI